MENSNNVIFRDIESILRGKTGKNLDIGILTAENEMGKTLPDAENNKRNNMLYKELSRIAGARVYQIQGNFGGVDENSFIVTGIPLKILKKLASNYRQQSFIYGNGRNDDMIFHYMDVIDSEDEPLDYDSTQIRRTFIFKPDAKSNYSLYKGIKFVIPFFDDDYIDVGWDELSPEERGESTENNEIEDKEEMKESYDKDFSKRLENKLNKFGINFFLTKACDDVPCEKGYYAEGRIFDRESKKFFSLGIKRPDDNKITDVDIIDEESGKKLFTLHLADKKFSDTWTYPKDSPRKYIDSVNYDEEDSKMEDTQINRIKKLVESLKMDEKAKVKIKVKHSDLLEIPEGKNFWQMPLKHFSDLVEKKGYAKVIRALNNIKVWHKNEDPSIGEKADKIMDKLKVKFRPENKD